MADGITQGFSRKEILKKYDLRSSANVESVKQALINKDLIYKEEKNFYFDDSLMKVWLKKAHLTN